MTRHVSAEKIQEEPTCSVGKGSVTRSGRVRGAALAEDVRADVCRTTAATVASTVGPARQPIIIRPPAVMRLPTLRICTCRKHNTIHKVLSSCNHCARRVSDVAADREHDSDYGILAHRKRSTHEIYSHNISVY